MTALLRLSDVSLERGGRLLFEGLSLSLGSGEAVQVAGPNGSGKSSLIRLAAGLLRPLAGSVERTEAALADEAPALDRELALGRALRFWARLGSAEARLADAMAGLGLSELADVPVRLLSAGQTRRATLARVAASGARLWLLDEPVNGLDTTGVTQLGEAIAGHLADGGAVLAASHVPLAGHWRRLELGG